MLYVRHIIQVVLTAAFGAGIPERTAVQFPHGLTARRLMQAVYVLRDDGGKLSRSFKFDRIIEYCIRKKVYNVLTVNEVLFAFDQLLLGG